MNALVSCISMESLTMPTTTKLLFSACTVCFLAQGALGAGPADWRSWRGPLGNGSTDQGNYAVEFSATKHLWRTQLPGKGCSTPIWLGERIYLTAPVDGRDALLCYDFLGAERWRAVFGQENAGK